MSYEENVRAILQTCFSQSKDEVIETAVKAIMGLENRFYIPITVPSHPPTPYTPVYINPTGTPPEPFKRIEITCKNSTNSEN